MMHTSISHKWPMQLFQKLTQGLPQKVLLLLLVQDLFNRLQDFSKKTLQDADSRLIQKASNSVQEVDT